VIVPLAIGCQESDHKLIRNEFQIVVTQSAATHSNPDEKTDVTLTWTPDSGFDGTVVFK